MTRQRRGGGRRLYSARMGLAEPLPWKWKSGRIAVPPERLAEAHNEFLVDLDEAALQADSADIGALFRLGETYTRMGLYMEGLAIDLRLSLLLPEDDTVQYNLACSYALMDQPDQAFQALEAAITAGYSDVAHLQADEDLESLHEDPRFDAIVARLTAPE
jgi:tetratricopeptide (TPR) repeat protein